MSDQKLRNKLIRLAHSKPELRADLLPLVKTAGFDLRSAWETIIQKHNKGLRADMKVLVKKIAAVLKKEDLIVDMNRSHLGLYYHGSDGYRMDGMIRFQDTALDRDGYTWRDKDALEELLWEIDIYGSLSETGSEIWELDLTES